MHSSCPSIDKALDICKVYKTEDLPSGARRRIKLYTDIKEDKLITDKNKKIHISSIFEAYNSGIIEMNLIYEYLLESVLELTDLIYKK